MTTKIITRTSNPPNYFPGLQEFVDESVARFRETLLNSAAISRALELKGLTDAQARAIIAAASSVEAGLIAIGLMKAPVVTPGPGPDPDPDPEPEPEPEPGTMPAVRTTHLAGVGINPSRDSAGVPTFMLIDRMKTCSYGEAPWNGADTPLDDYGYIVGHRPGATNTATAVAILREQGKVHRYVLDHTGSPDMDIRIAGGVTIISELSTPNRIVFDAPYNAGSINGILVDIHGTPTKWATGPDAIRIYNIEHEALLNAGKVVDPRFIDDTDDWTDLRGMDLFGTNGSHIVTMADLTPVGYVTYGLIASFTHFKALRLPLETLVKVANECKLNLWFCVPHMATDATVRAMFEYIRDNLDPDLYFKPEYTNENGWNTEFTQSIWSDAEAKKINSSWTGDHFHGLRAGQVAVIANDVFKDQRHRLHNMWMRQSAGTEAHDKSIIGLEYIGLKFTEELFSTAGHAAYTDAGGLQPLGQMSAAHKSTMLQVAQDSVETGVVPSQIIAHARDGSYYPEFTYGETNVTVDRQVAIYAAALKKAGIPNFQMYELQDPHNNVATHGVLNEAEQDLMIAFTTLLVNDERYAGAHPGSLMWDKWDAMLARGVNGGAVLSPHGKFGRSGLWASKEHAYSAPTLRDTMYREYQKTAQGKLIPEVLMWPDLPIMEAGYPAKRKFTRYGGVWPAGKLTLISGVPTGMAWDPVKCELTGSPTAGTYNLLFQVIDGAGMVHQLTKTVSAQAMTRYKYYSLRILELSDSNQQYGTATEIEMRNAEGVAQAGVFTAPGSDNGNLLGDGRLDTGAGFRTPPVPIIWTAEQACAVRNIAIAAGGAYDRSPGKFEVRAHTEVPPSDGTGGTLLKTISGATTSEWQKIHAQFMVFSLFD